MTTCSYGIGVSQTGRGSASDRQILTREEIEKRARLLEEKTRVDLARLEAERVKLLYPSPEIKSS